VINLDGLPMPEDAPRPASCIGIERPSPELMVLTLDPPHRSMAVLDLPLMRDLDLALDHVDAEKGLTGLVITGREPLSFAAGADIDAIESADDPALVERVVSLGQQVFQRIANLSHVTTVAAVGGPVPGGAFELGLACDYIVAADDPKTRIGLPETQLGILPAWGGTTRLPRRIGVPAAADAILTGRLFPAKVALKRGMVDRLTKPEYLVRVASEIATGKRACKRKRRGLAGLFIDRNPIVTSIIASKARDAVMKRTKGKYPAPLEALEILVRSPLTSTTKSLRAEAQATARLATGSVCKSLISIFQGTEAAKRLGRGPEGEAAPVIHRAAVVGAGVMGGAVASLLAEKGVATRLCDLSPAALDGALHEHRKVIGTKLKRRRLARHEAAQALDRLDVTRDGSGLGRSEIVIEAVAERLEVKQAVFAALAEQLSDDAILATNTSSLSVDAIAEGLPHPERVCGMHFFNPVRKMPLVEIIRGSRTDERVVRAVAALAVRMGKFPVIVADVAGFLINRILGPYLDEAMRLFEEGADPARVDHLLEDFGMPMGPFLLLDEVGFDIAAHAAKSLHEAYGVRMTPTMALDGLQKQDRLGKKTGLGFYVHGTIKKGKRKGRPARPTLATDLPVFKRSGDITPLSDWDIVDRLVLAMVAEGARCLEEDVVAGPAELDLATVMGIGFAPFTGGLMRYADARGTGEIAKRLRTIAASPAVARREGGPERFAACTLLLELAEGGRGFHG
jgi:3-hydroxyacyl-CoA dehydrogenase/enoyl-CoA hydratase/3-hydroxybutyryl-CoA epimerase